MLGNSKLTSPQIQKDVVYVAFVETSKAIINDLDDELFSILIDESRDIAVKKQMTCIM